MKTVKVLFGTPERAIKFLYKVELFDARMDLSKENFCVNAKSVISVLNSDIEKPMNLVIHEDSDSTVHDILRELSDYLVVSP